MPLPSINIVFKTTAADAVKRSQKGVVALIIRGSKDTAISYSLTSASQIPSTLTNENRDYIARAFIGYVNPPRKVIVYVTATGATDLTDALAFMETQRFDYLCAPPDVTEAEATAVASWIKTQRLQHRIFKAVLPNMSADHEGVINFVAEDIDIGGASKLTAAQFCSRIAGVIAGTPMNIGCTYAPLPEVRDIKRLTEAEGDGAVDAGKLILIHDGTKVKVGRGVNSLVTTTQDKGAIFKKIKIVEGMDMIQSDVRLTAQDSYVGKYANSYDNKLLLVTAIAGYFAQLEMGGILQNGASFVGIDLDAQEAYLQSIGVDTSTMSEQKIKEANTADKVFLMASIKILDVIEDIDLNIKL